MKKYRVRLVARRVVTAKIEVEAEDAEEARALAEEQAETLPNSAWIREPDSDWIATSKTRTSTKRWQVTPANPRGRERTI